MSHNITYLNFDILVERSGDQYLVRVLDSPAGQASSTFSFPYSDLEIENFILRIGRPRRGTRRLESPEMQTARSYGTRLFEALFRGEVRSRLRSSINEVVRQNTGLRLRLRLGEVPELSDLPWEYLYDPSADQFLVLSVNTPLVHYLDLPQRIRPLEVAPPLNILVMISSPTDYAPLYVEQEWSNLKTALADLEKRSLIHLEKLEEATLTTLQRQLRHNEYHIFHFIGHGGFDEDAQDGLLLLEDGSGRGRPVSGRYLGTLLHDEQSLRLAVLNACEGARTSRTDPFAGTAQSLVQRGIPAVIAMKFEITDQAAIILANEFYASLSDGYPVDAALAEARKAIFASDNDVEWGTPVLHLRAPDGMIFDVLQKPSEASVPGGQEVALKELYGQGIDALWQEEWEKASRNFQAIVDRNPYYRDATERLEQAQFQSHLGNLYERARTAMEEEDWETALAALEQLAEKDPEFKDATSKLEAVKTQKQLSEHYTEVMEESHDLLEGQAEPATLPMSPADSARVRRAHARPVSWYLSRRPLYRILMGMASLVVLLGLSYGSYLYLNQPAPLISSKDMVRVDAGTYRVGSGEEQREVTLAEYWLDMFETTNGEFEAFAQATRHATPAYWQNGQVQSVLEKHPVRDIDHQTAQEYCRWAGKRLPTEAEWEVAARGPFGWTYPWGDDENAIPAVNNISLPVGDLPANRSYFGAYDMAGNVWEWVSNPGPSVGEGEQVIRGGSNEFRQPLYDRESGDPNTPTMTNRTGIRCAADASRVETGINPSTYEFADDFSDSESGWPTFDEHKSDKQLLYNYHPAKWFHIHMEVPNVFLPAFYKQKSFQDFVLETQVFLEKKEGYNSGQFRYGLALLFPNEQFYAFTISGNSKEWFVQEGELPSGMTYGDISKLEEISRGGTQAINGVNEDKSDRLTVILSGGKINYLINGSIVFSDDKWGDPQDKVSIGFIGESLEDVDKVHIHYDWVTVQAIPPFSPLAKVEAADLLPSPVAPSETEEFIAPTSVDPSAVTPTPALSITQEPTATQTSEVQPTPSSPAPTASARSDIVEIKPGTYTIGENSTEVASFWIDRYEVTNAEYSEFISKTNSPEPANWPGDGPSNPVSGITRQQAVKYCAWASKRLPTAVEWEAAARGPFAWHYPWGNRAFNNVLPNSGTYPVRSRPINRSYFGAFDMLGNVSEWTVAKDPLSGADTYVLRGGDNSLRSDLTEPVEGDPENPIYYRSAGIRCAADLVTPTRAGSIAPDDDFEDGGSGWVDRPDEIEFYKYGYHPPGDYHLQISKTNECLAVVRTEPLSEFMAEVQAYTLRTNTEFGDYGYGFVLRTSGSDFIGLLIYPRSNRWLVVENTPQGLEQIDEGIQTEIYPPDDQERNRLFVIADDSTLTFFVNGNLVSQQPRPWDKALNIGLFMKTEDESFAHIHFDDLSVLPLPAGSWPVAKVSLPSRPTEGKPASSDICGAMVVGNVLNLTYLVKPGDTWFTIANKYQLSVAELKEANGYNPGEPRILQVGEGLIIPTSEGKGS